MATIDPGTRSPGHVFYEYTHAGKARTMSMRMTASVDPSVLGPIGEEMATNAPFFAAVMPATVTISGWGVRRNDGSVAFRAAFTTPFVGGLNGVNEQGDWFSTTLCLQGRGGATALDNAAGVSLTRLHIGGTIHIPQGMKYINASVQGLPYTELQNQLNLSTRFFADFYGQKADVQDRMPIQFNAHTQLKDGT